MDDWGSKPWQTFADRAISLRKAIGADSFPVINREKHPQEWRDWYAYYGARGMLASRDMMRAKPDKTVPTISPFDFDATWNPDRPSPEVPDDRKDNWERTSDAMRERHAQRYPGLLGNSQWVPMPNEPKSADEAA